jgi:hypothetical protein
MKQNFLSKIATSLPEKIPKRDALISFVLDAFKVIVGIAANTALDQSTAFNFEEYNCFV